MAAIRREECFFDADHARGEMTADEVDEMVRKHHPARGMKSAELGLRGEMQQVSREPPAGHKWVSMSEGDGFDLSIKLGDEITLGPQDLVTGNKAIHFTSVAGNRSVFCQAVPVAEVTSFRRAFRAGLSDEGSGGPALGPKAAEADEEADDKGDARLLPGPV